MEIARTEKVTEILRAWTTGDAGALDRLIPIVYTELRRTAAGYMRREREGHSLQATELVNEAFLRLVDVQQVTYRDRTHFYALAAQTMRRVLVDHARSRRYQKRGGGIKPMKLDEGAVISAEPPIDLVRLDDALTEMQKQDPRKAQVVELRFFGGLSIPETAAALDVSPQTVLRDWSLAKAWLRREMKRGGE